MASEGGDEAARRSHTEEFKAEAVFLVLGQGVSSTEVANDLDLTESALRNWVRAEKQRRARGSGGNLTPSERDELKRLRKEIKILREEKAILKKATTFFAKENR